VNKRKFQGIILTVALVNGQGLTGGYGQRADALIDMDTEVIAAQLNLLVVVQFK